MRLLDVLLKMRADYKGKYIQDDQLLDKLAEYSFPEMRAYRRDKLRYPRIVVSENFTDKQRAFRAMFFGKQSE